MWPITFSSLVSDVDNSCTECENRFVKNNGLVIGTYCLHLYLSLLPFPNSKQIGRYQNNNIQMGKLGDSVPKFS